MAKLSDLERLAVRVALSAALVNRGVAGRAYVSWDVVDGIRAELDRLGVDWRVHHRSSEVGILPTANRTR